MNKRVLGAAVIAAAAVAATPRFSFGQLKAFPDAEGFGQYATGGRGGSIYHVTTLADSGTGSFRDAVSASGRIVVFDVSGYITLSSAVSVKNNITIAGQTAPGGGIGITGREVSFSSSSNVVVRDVRFRQGDTDPDSGKSGINLGSANNMIFDHISVEFAQWDNIDAVGATNWTLQNSIDADPIGQQFGSHAEGDNVTFANNLWANAHNRQPLTKGDTQYVNNVVYNYQAGYTAGNTAGHNSHDIVNNTFIAGPATTSSGNAWYQLSTNDSVYASGNKLDSNSDGVLNGGSSAPGGVTVLASPWSSATQYLPTLGSSNTDANNAYNYVLNHAGAGGLAGRDAVDALVVSQVQTLGNGPVGQGAGTAGPNGGLYTHQNQTGLGNGGLGTLASGVKATDTDNDGIPDAWETAHGMNPNSAADASLLNPVGYMMIEQYFNELADTNLSRTWSAASGAWSVAANWSGGVTAASPIILEHALVRGTGAANGSVTINATGATALSLSIGGNGPAGGESVTVTAGTLTVYDTINVGDQNNGSLTITAGTTRAANIVLGNTVGTATYTGALNVSGGVLQVNQIVLGGGLVGNYTTGGSVTWAGGTIQADGTMRVNAPLALTNSPTLDSNGFGGTFSGVISGSGTLIKIGAGAINLTASNSFAGGVTIQGGELGASNDSNLGGPATPLTFSGGLLKINSSSLANLNTHTVNWSTFNGGFDVVGSGTSFAVSQAIGGSGSVTITGAGTVSLIGSNSYSGGTNLNGGITIVSADSNLGAPASLLNMSGGTLRVTGTSFTSTANHPLNTFNGGTFDINTAGAVFTINQQVNGTGNLTKAGAGTLVLGTRDYFTGATFLTGGTLRINDDLSLRYTTVNLTTAGTVLDLNGHNATIGNLAGTQGFDLKGVTIYVGNNDDDSTYSGVIANSIGTGGVTKIGSGTYNPTGASTYNGPTTIAEGTLLATMANGGAASALGASSNAAPNLVLSGGTLQGVGTTDRLFTLAANSTLDNTSGFSIGSNGPIAMPAGANLTLTLAGTSTAHNTLSAQLPDPAGGTLSITKVDAGKWTFSTGAKTYSGTTDVQAGTLETLSANNLSPNSPLIIESGATLELHGNSQRIDILSGAGTLTNSFGTTSQTLTLGVSGGGGTFSGTITSTLSLAKAGAGVEYLTGSNSFVGNTTITGGAIVYATSASTGATAAAVIVGPGGAAGSQAGIANAAFVAKLNAGSTGALAILNAADAATSLNFTAAPLSAVANIALGTLIDTTYTGTLTPASNTYRLGGGGGTLTFPAAITGAKNIIIGSTGSSGAVVLTASNTFTGTTLIQGGDLRIAGIPSFPALTPVSITGGQLTFTTNGNKVFRPSSLMLAGATHGGAINPTVAIDLNNNDAIIPSASYSADEIRRLILTGTGGTSGILASTALPGQALGYITGSDYATLQANNGTLFDNVSIAPTDVLIKYTYQGDADFSGRINLSDYALIDAGFLLQIPNPGWVNGDFNYDGVVDYKDYALIDYAFSHQTSGQLADAMIEQHTMEFGAAYTSALAQMESSVPEPASALLSMGGIVLLGRRRPNAILPRAR